MTCRNRKNGENWARSTVYYLVAAAGARPRTLRRIGATTRRFVRRLTKSTRTYSPRCSGVGVERAAAVEPGHVGDELGQRPRPLEHERVDRDPLLRAALHLAEGLLDRPPGRRVVELDLAVLEVGGRLAVGDDHDLLVDRRVALEDPPGQEQAVLEVRAVLVAVPGQLGQRARPDLAGVVGEADDRQVVARVLRPDQRVERDRDLLGGEEAAAQQHRAAHVHEQDRRGLGQLLGPVDLEIGRREVDPPVAGRGPGGRRVLLAAEGVEQRPAQVEVERVAELVRLGRLVALPAPAAAVDPVAAERVALEPREQVVEDLLADPPAAARGQLEALAVAGQVAGLLEPAGQVVERLEVADARRRRAGRGPRRGRWRPGRPATRRRTARPPAGPSPGAGRSARGRPRARAARRRRTGPGRRARRAAAGRGSRRAGRDRPAAGRRAAAPPSSSSSSARCSGLIERMQRLHRGHPLGQLVDDVVEGLGAREELAVLGQELRWRPGRRRRSARGSAR